MKYLEIKCKKEKKARSKLLIIVNSYANRANYSSEEKNLEAKEKIIKFYKALERYKTSTHYELGYTATPEVTHTSYIIYLLKIKEALDKKLYERACDVIGDMIYSEPIFQRRIYNSIIDLLKNYFNIHSDSV